jgi:lysozyme family protein
MTASNREAAISKTLQYEGGYTNNPHDPGGATNWGITIADARKYWKPDATPEDVKGMPKEVAVDIYRKKYWQVMGCDTRDTGPDFVDFDCGVNSGVGRVLTFRKVLDPQHLTPVEYVKAACAMRSSFLHGLKTYAYFGTGWSRRVAAVEATGIKMAAGEHAPTVLRKEAGEATKKVVAHSAGTVATTTTAVHHTLAAGHQWLAIAAIGASLAALLWFFIWHAYHNSVRASEMLKAIEEKL